MNSASPVLLWFRDDLRLADNPALAAAVETGRPIIPVYILDETSPGVRPLGGASKWWLDKSLRRLDGALQERGGALVLRRGAAGDVLQRLVNETGAAGVFWNRRYGAARHTDSAVKTRLKAMGAAAESRCGATLVEPPAMARAPQGGFKVFTPFWKALRQEASPPPPAPAPDRAAFAPAASDDLDAWGLHPSRPDWSGGIAACWTPGESAAAARLARFIDDGLKGYADRRDRPDLDATSRLSPHLRWGEISPWAVWRAVQAAGETGQAKTRDVEKFLSELAWRDFSHHLLYHDPDMTRLSWRRRFDDIAWRSEEAEIEAWRRGRTGFPIVDAGMREVWATGWMHNRARMIAASFLVKHLLVHWRIGEAWFWDVLVDADEANNAAGWQWVAGSGADAAPYFRVFNPELQADRHDPHGAYVLRWAPEARASADGTRNNYPAPMVDLAAGRDRALAAYAVVKSSRSAEEGPSA